MTLTRLITNLLVASFALSISWEVAANCAGPARYHGGQDGDQVTICLYNSDDIECPTESPMLRENVETGEVVQLADFCDQNSYDSCYVDECVPAGSYRYGMAQKYPCSASYCGGIDLFVTIDVVDTSPECSLSPDNDGTTPYADDFSWQGGGQSSESCPDNGPLGGSCSIAAPGTVDVFGLNLLVGLLGVFLVWRKKKKQP